MFEALAPESIAILSVVVGVIVGILRVLVHQAGTTWFREGTSVQLWFGALFIALGLVSLGSFHTVVFDCDISKNQCSLSVSGHPTQIIDVIGISGARAVLAPSRSVLGKRYTYEIFGHNFKIPICCQHHDLTLSEVSEAVAAIDTFLGDEDKEQSSFHLVHKFQYYFLSGLFLSLGGLFLVEYVSPSSLASFWSRVSVAPLLPLLYAIVHFLNEHDWDPAMQASFFFFIAVGALLLSQIVSGNAGRVKKTFPSKRKKRHQA
eukprot:Rmarinus@m.21850